MSDYIVKGISGSGQIRIFAATTAGLVEEGRRHHECSPIATAALGRLMTAAAMMGSMMKGEEDVLTLSIHGDGPMGNLLATADSSARVKGYMGNPNVVLPANAAGKLDVGGAVGNGYLTVIRDIGMKEPYSGRVELQTGEIAEDLTYYFAVSEQTPSSVGLGVLMNKDNTVRCAGGFIVQLMPFAEEEDIAALEENLRKITSVTDLLKEGKTPEDLINMILEGLEPEITETVPTEFYCNCDKARVEKALISIGKKELEEMIRDGKDVELKCQFCNTAYVFTPEELKKLAAKSS